jgi:hypothetical protein
MAVESYEVQLERVQTAIAKIENGAQEAEYEGRRVKRADLKTLYEREAQLRSLIDKQSRKGSRIGRFIPR